MPNNENQLPATSSPYPEADNNQVLLPLDVARVVTSFMTENDLFHIEPIGKLSDRNYQKILQLNTRTNLVTAMLLEKREGTTPSKSYINLKNAVAPIHHRSKLNNALSISWRQKPFYPDCGIKIGG